MPYAPSGSNSEEEEEEEEDTSITIIYNLSLGTKLQICWQSVSCFPTS
jgi:hypothetical protein